MYRSQATNEHRVKPASDMCYGYAMKHPNAQVNQGVESYGVQVRRVFGRYGTGKL